MSTENGGVASAAPPALGAAALEYAGRGWRVFPCAGKIPRTANGCKAASDNPERVREWWQRWPGAAIGVATGGDLVVLDVDGEAGAESLRTLERTHGELPRTASVVTPSGGSHFYFRHRGGIRNSAGKLGTGLDVRGEGGYVVAPPSPGYEPDEEAPIAELPPWLARLLRAERRNGHRPASEWRELARNGVAQGERNERTAQLAGHLLARSVDPFVALELLVAWDARNRPPLGRGEVERVVASIAGREARKWE